MIYVDTSVLVPLYAKEPSSAYLSARIASLVPGEAAISDWTILEFASAIARIMRARRLNRAGATEAVKSLAQLASESLQVYTVQRDDFGVAQAWISDFSTDLRAGDALHLAIARRTAAHLWTLDQGLQAAARRHGVPLYR
ncbi:MAG: type II toxin-antitoxin system VapC family toxin [Terriglobales bacterium]